MAHVVMFYCFQYRVSLSVWTLEQSADCLYIVQPMPLHHKTPSSLASFKSRLDLPFWMFDRGLGQILHDQLHWLDIPDRVLFKLAVTVHQCLNGRALP